LQWSKWNDHPLQNIEAFFGKDFADELIRGGLVKPEGSGQDAPIPVLRSEPAPTVPATLEVVKPEPVKPEVTSSHKVSEPPFQSLSVGNKPPPAHPDDGNTMPPIPDWSYDDHFYRPDPTHTGAQGIMTDGMINLKKLSGDQHQVWKELKVRNPRFCWDRFCTSSGCALEHVCSNRHIPPTPAEYRFLSWFNPDFLAMMEDKYQANGPHSTIYTRLFPDAEAAARWGLNDTSR
jgi:hypothetical protein